MKGVKIYACIKSLENDYEFMGKIKTLSNLITIHPTLQRPTKKELCKIVRDYDIIICGIFEKLDRDVAKNVRRLKIIGTLSVGLDHIDVDAFKYRGVKTINVPHSNAISVAEHTWAFILSLAKRLPEADVAVRENLGREGVKDRSIELYQKTLGIVGAGPVAYYVAMFAKAFEMNVLVWTFRPEKHKEFIEIGANFVNRLEDLLQICDILTVHIQLSDKTRNLINKKLLYSINREKSLIIINTSRQEIIEKGLIPDGLQQGYIDRCGLDVYYDDEISFCTKYKVIFSPHIAGLSREAIKRMRLDLLEKIENIMNNMG